MKSFPMPTVFNGFVDSPVMDFSQELNDIGLLNDAFASVNSLPQIGTVSPQDLLLSDGFSSVPNSASPATITTPSLYNESPPFKTSPSFGFDIESSSTANWFPLFPQEASGSPKEVTLETLAATVCPPVSPVRTIVAPEITSLRRTEDSGIRRKSLTHSVRHSASAGVNVHRRTKPLPPIIIEDPSDTVAMKRARNTLAARKSRERKAQRLEDLEERIVELEKDCDHWKQLYLNLVAGGV